jgi:hypothetical protein
MVIEMIALDGAEAEISFFSLFLPYHFCLFGSQASVSPAPQK